jgi:hypothetical protein
VANTLDLEVAIPDLVLALVALVVVLVRVDDTGAAGLRRYECYQLRSTHCPRTLYTISLSGRWLLGACP